MSCHDFPSARAGPAAGRLRLGSARFERRRPGPGPPAPLAKPAGGRTGPKTPETWSEPNRPVVWPGPAGTGRANYPDCPTVRMI